MPRAGGISKLLGDALTILCCWGLVTALVFQLIELRCVFIAGGEWRLREASLALALGAVAVERLVSDYGRAGVRSYSATFIILVTILAAQIAAFYRIPIHPVIVFLSNETVFLALWWSARRLARACFPDTAEATEASGASGLMTNHAIMRRIKKRRAQESQTDEQIEAKWQDRLPTAHPGRILLHFSLFAVPVFGAGIFLIPAGDAAHLRMGWLLFIYLWCAMALLCLSSLSQLRAYFAKRDVDLPEAVGLPWLGIGLALVTAALLLAFILPQPMTVQTLAVRERMVASYSGWEGTRGRLDTAHSNRPGGQPGAQGGGKTTEQIESKIDESHREIDKGKTDALSEDVRHSGAEQMYRNAVKAKGEMDRMMEKAFDWISFAIVAVGALCALFVLYALAFGFARGAAQGMSAMKLFRRARKPPKPEPFALRRFGAYADPFSAAGLAARGPGGLTGNALVRYLWEAMLAYCADAGSACAPDQTPLEFVGAAPPPLAGFEAQAKSMADMFSFSEFSNEPFPENKIPLLREFWNDLNSHIKGSK